MELKVTVVESIAADRYFVLTRQPSNGRNNFAGQPDVWTVDSYWESPLMAHDRADFLKGREV